MGVTYVAPRAVKSTQPEIFFEMAKKMGMNLDPAEKVAKIIVSAIEAEKSEVYIGGPEKFFTFVNKLKPTMVDNGLRKQVAVMEEYCGKF